MNIVFFILWIFSFLGWIFCVFKMNKGGKNKYKYETGMWVLLVLMWVFSFAIKAGAL